MSAHLPPKWYLFPTQELLALKLTHECYPDRDVTGSTPRCHRAIDNQIREREKGRGYRPGSVEGLDQ